MRQKIEFQSPDKSKTLTLHLVHSSLLDALPLSYQALQIPGVPERLFLSTLKWKSWKQAASPEAKHKWLHRHILDWVPGKFDGRYDQRIQAIMEQQAAAG